jgi:flagellar motor switch/type III secretory pathway protein FliN
MTNAYSMLDAEVMVSAVISRTQMPAVSLAALEPGDFLDTEPEIGSPPIVRLTIGATTVALASIAKVEGRLIATIINNRPDVSGRKGDTWKVRKPKRSTD